MKRFKYIEDATESFVKSNEEKVCSCCGKKTNIYMEIFYSIENIDALCLECVASGEAAKQFDGTFNEATYINNIVAMEEVEKRTPHIMSFQDFIWPACCNDMCRYLRPATKQDFKNDKFWQDISQTYKEQDIMSIEEIKQINPNYLLLFECLHCKKYHIIVDLD